MKRMSLIPQENIMVSPVRLYSTVCWLEHSQERDQGSESCVVSGDSAVVQTQTLYAEQTIEAGTMPA